MSDQHAHVVVVGDDRVGVRVLGGGGLARGGGRSRQLSSRSPGLGWRLAMSRW
jgi:hypothetical protein